MAHVVDSQLVTEELSKQQTRGARVTIGDN